MNKAINGTFGRVWVNNEDYGTVKQFEAKVPLESGICSDSGKTFTVLQIHGL